jgi:BirA family transcriptional regulator, biotin operon repressor / biotin---[acetyl-CoA-carboxylase] ligase
VLGADVQTAGRGRRQRPWLSVSGQCVTFSVSLPSYQGIEIQHLSSLPLAVGLAVMNAVKRWANVHDQILHGALALKWPNDVLCNKKKVAGILIESKSAVVVGIGVNVFLSPQLQQSLPLKATPVSGAEAMEIVEPGGLLLDLASVDATALADLVAKVVLEVLNADKHHRMTGLGNNAERWNAVHLFHDKEVCLTDGDQIVQQGVVLGVGSQGELLLRDSLGQVQRVLSGDLSLRQAPLA